MENKAGSPSSCALKGNCIGQTDSWGGDRKIHYDNSTSDIVRYSTNMMRACVRVCTRYRANSLHGPGCWASTRM